MDNRGPDMGGSGGNDRIMYALTYPLPIVGVILLLTKKEDPDARFHALNSLFYCVAAFVASMILAFIPIIGWFLSMGLFVYSIYLGYLAYQGNKPVIPFVTDFAEKYASNMK